jgi:hypothetical protein
MTKAEGKTLKEQNQGKIILFILWCIALYLAFQVAPGGLFTQLKRTLPATLAKDSIPMILSPLVALILTGIISSDGKARLVFCRWRHALPGHRAFSRLAVKDPRIDMNKLRRLVVPWPQTRADENRVWYGIYKKYEDVPKVLDSHRAFLLSRDIATIAFLFGIGGTAGLVFTLGNLEWPFIYALAMLVHYIVFMIVARNHANRFVCNVLTEYVSGAS